jgi:hypothetical protein
MACISRARRPARPNSATLETGPQNHPRPFLPWSPSLADAPERIGSVIIKDTKLDVVHQAFGHEALATTSDNVGLARKAMEQELQRNAL